MACGFYIVHSGTQPFIYAWLLSECKRQQMRYCIPKDALNQNKWVTQSMQLISSAVISLYLVSTCDPL